MMHFAPLHLYHVYPVLRLVSSVTDCNIIILSISRSMLIRCLLKSKIVVQLVAPPPIPNNMALRLPARPWSVRFNAIFIGIIKKNGTPKHDVCQNPDEDMPKIIKTTKSQAMNMTTPYPPLELQPSLLPPHLNNIKPPRNPSPPTTPTSPPNPTTPSPSPSPSPPPRPPSPPTHYPPSRRD